MCDNWVVGKTIKSYFDLVDLLQRGSTESSKGNSTKKVPVGWPSCPCPRSLTPPPHAEVEADKGAWKTNGGGGCERET